MVLSEFDETPGDPGWRTIRRFRSRLEGFFSRRYPPEPDNARDADGVEPAECAKADAGRPTEHRDLAVRGGLLCLNRQHVCPDEIPLASQASRVRGSD